jgi:hypothetical protein
MAGQFTHMLVCQMALDPTTCQELLGLANPMSAALCKQLLGVQPHTYCLVLLVQIFRRFRTRFLGVCPQNTWAIPTFFTKPRERMPCPSSATRSY